MELYNYIVNFTLNKCILQFNVPFKEPIVKIKKYMNYLELFQNVIKC